MLIYLTIFTTIVSTSLLGIIFFLAHSTKSRNFFILVILLFQFWSITNYFSRVIENDEVVLLMMRLVMFSTSLLMLTIIYFANYFPDDKKILNTKVILVLSFFYTLLIMLSLTDLIIKESKLTEDGPAPVYGPAMPLYIIGLVFALSLFGVTEYFKSRTSDEIVKQKVRTVGFGVIVTSILGFITNIVFILVFGSVSMVELGPSFTLILLGCVTYSIIKHQLFDIRLIIGRLTYITVMSVVPYAIFYIVAILNIKLFGSIFEVESFLIAIIQAIIFIFLYDLINKFLREKIRSNIINPGFDPDVVVERFNLTVSSIIKQNELFAESIEILSHNLRINNIYFFLQSKPGQEGSERLFSKASLDVTETNVFLGLSKHIIELNLSKYINPQGSENGNLISDDLKVLMSNVGIEAFIRDQITDDIDLLLLLGKKDGNYYSSTELKFINTILNIISLALSRSLLFEEVQSFNATLQQKVDDATKELKTANKKLADSLRVEKDMLDIIGHELRTPLTVARSALDMMGMRKQLSKANFEGIDDLISKSKEALQRESKILDTILSSTRIENNRVVLKPDKVDCFDVVNDSLEGFSKDAEAKGLKLITQLPSQTIFAYADRAVTQQLIDNLVSNAIKYTFAGSVTIKLVEEPEFIRFSVTDTGEGISKDKIKNLGKKFYRINSHGSTDASGRPVIRPGGTGIGLYVVFNMVEKLGGKINIDSEVGKGSTFSFTLPKFDETKHKTLDQIAAENQNQAVANPQQSAFPQPKLPQPV